MLPEADHPQPELGELLERMEGDLKVLRGIADSMGKNGPPR